MSVPRDRPVNSDAVQLESLTVTVRDDGQHAKLLQTVEKPSDGISVPPPCFGKCRKAFFEVSMTADDGGNTLSVYEVIEGMHPGQLMCLFDVLHQQFPERDIRQDFDVLKIVFLLCFSCCHIIDFLLNFLVAFPQTIPQMIPQSFLRH